MKQVTILFVLMIILTACGNNSVPVTVETAKTFSSPQVQVATSIPTSTPSPDMVESDEVKIKPERELGETGDSQSSEQDLQETSIVQDSSDINIRDEIIGIWQITEMPETIFIFYENGEFFNVGFREIWSYEFVEDDVMRIVHPEGREILIPVSISDDIMTLEEFDPIMPIVHFKKLDVDTLNMKDAGNNIVGDWTCWASVPWWSYNALQDIHFFEDGTVTMGIGIDRDYIGYSSPSNSECERVIYVLEEEFTYDKGKHIMEFNPTQNGMFERTAGPYYLLNGSLVLSLNDEYVFCFKPTLLGYQNVPPPPSCDEGVSEAVGRTCSHQFEICN